MVMHEEQQQELHTGVETKEGNNRSNGVQNKPWFLEVMNSEEKAEVFRNRESSFHRLNDSNVKGEL